ncbi:unnamed protein product [Lactuca saligna]|uniref:Uncharacterized protein n=1 Tax=Lactuca saligna TaxID=75948 RepID=A0AA35VP02_LACSI|nr:unnamed protein product [Lactuca saligna]
MVAQSPSTGDAVVSSQIWPWFYGQCPSYEGRVRTASPVRGSGVAGDQVISRHRSAAANSAHEEDISSSIIGRRLRRKRNTDPLLINSPIVIEIIDGDDPQVMETTNLRWLG